MERILLNAERREVATKGALRSMRLDGKVPGVLYGKKRNPELIVVGLAELTKATSTKAGLNVLVDLALAGQKLTTVLIRDYQAHPLRRVFTHVDFQVIDVTEKIIIEVPIILLGQAVGVKEGGILEQLLRKIEVRCLATQIPENIAINVEHLKIGDSIHVSDIKFAEGVELPRAMNYTVATVVPPVKEEVPVPAVAPVEGAAPAEGAVAPAEGAAAPAEGAAAPAKGAAAAAPKAERAPPKVATAPDKAKK